MTTYTILCKRTDGSTTLIGPFWDEAEAEATAKRMKKSRKYYSVVLETHRK